MRGHATRRVEAPRHQVGREPAAPSHRRARTAAADGPGLLARAGPAFRVAGPVRPAGAPVQRLVINTGDDALPAELSLDRGWIVGSDMDIAFQEGGYGQKVKELDAVGPADRVRPTENIYLEGHGEPGKLGTTLPADVAAVLNPIIPSDYQGKIRSHSCSAGASPGPNLPSGVEALANALNEPGIRVQGASGVALNHLAYFERGGPEQGTRVIAPGAVHDLAVDTAINNTRGPVDRAWRQYVQSRGGTIKNFQDAAVTATKVSRKFYKNLERRVENHLLPKAQSIQENTSGRVTRNKILKGLGLAALGAGGLIAGALLAPPLAALGAVGLLAGGGYALYHYLRKRKRG